MTQNHVKAQQHGDSSDPDRDTHAYPRGLDSLVLSVFDSQQEGSGFKLQRMQCYPRPCILKNMQC